MVFTQEIETFDKCVVCGRYVLPLDDILKLKSFPDNVWSKSENKNIDTLCSTCSLWGMDKGVFPCAQ